MKLTGEQWKQSISEDTTTDKIVQVESCRAVCQKKNVYKAVIW